MEADGADPRALVANLVADGAPAWSPDGARIAFTGFDPAERAPAAAVRDVWVVDADGSGATNVTHLPGPADALSPSWSADGTRLVWATTDWDLWIINVDGSDRRQITSDPAHQNLPAWSPEGSLIAYCSIPVEGNLVSGDEDVWVMEPDGGDPRQLTDTGKSCSPAWSPDGSQIAFVTWVFTVTGDHSDVWVMNADGSAQRNVTNDPTRIDRSPAWSPDGTRLAFVSAGPFRVREDPQRGEVIEHDPPANIYLIPAAEGGPKTQLTVGDHGDAAPSWEPAES